MSRPHRPSKAALATFGGLRSSTGTLLADAASDPLRAPDIRYRTWGEYTRSLFFLPWSESHTGLFFYDGQDVWVAKRYGHRGYHRCGQNRGIGFTVTVENCTENVIYVDTRPGYGIQNWDYFEVSAVYHGFPISADHHMHVNVYPSGNVYYY